MFGFSFRIHPKHGKPFTVRKVANDLISGIENVVRDGYPLATIGTVEVILLKHSPAIYAADIARYMAVAPNSTRADVLTWAVEMLPGLTLENIDTYAAAYDFWPRKKA